MDKKSIMKKTEGYKKWKAEKELISDEGVYPSEEKQYTHRDMECVRNFEDDGPLLYILILIIWLIGILIGYYLK